MYKKIEDNFNRNLKRVKNLFSLYDAKGKGRKSVQDTDALRATVVFLHASLENFMRELIRYKMPDADEKTINTIPLIGNENGSRAEKFLLGALLKHKGKSVDNLINECVEAQMNKISFNSIIDIMSYLKSINLIYDDSKLKLLNYLNEMIERRHHIVHQADSNKITSPGSYHAKAINKKTVKIWMDKTEIFVFEVLKIAQST